MKKYDYLKIAISTEAVTRKAWFISAFATINENTGEYKKDPYPARIVQEPTGVYYLDPQTKDLVRIEDAVPGNPLFAFRDKVVIDSSWMANVSQQTETTVGNVLVNKIALVECFGSKLPYLAGSISVGRIENMIAPRLKDTPPQDRPGGFEGEPVVRTQGDIYVDEFIKFCDSISFLSGLTQLCAISTTRTNITSAPGMYEYKNKILNEEFGGKITDAVTLAKFEKKLQLYDEVYLKDDPSYNRFIKGKVKANARRKLYRSQGADKTFTEGVAVHPIMNSLEEGWPTGPADWVTVLNVSRAGSYGRGKDTQLGGVVYKVIMGVASNILVHQADCGTTIGLRTTLTADLTKQLVGREVLEGKQWKLIETNEQANQYINRPIELRSSMFCKLKDGKCSHCMGKLMSRSQTEVAHSLANISSGILAASMSAFHAKELQVAKMDLQSAFS